MAATYTQLNNHAEHELLDMPCVQDLLLLLLCVTLLWQDRVATLSMTGPG